MSYNSSHDNTGTVTTLTHHLCVHIVPASELTLRCCFSGSHGDVGTVTTTHRSAHLHVGSVLCVGGQTCNTKCHACEPTNHQFLISCLTFRHGIVCSPPTERQYPHPTPHCRAHLYDSVSCVRYQTLPHVTCVTKQWAKCAILYGRPAQYMIPWQLQIVSQQRPCICRQSEFCARITVRQW